MVVFCVFISENRYTLRGSNSVTIFYFDGDKLLKDRICSLFEMISLSRELEMQMGSCVSYSSL